MSKMKSTKDILNPQNCRANSCKSKIDKDIKLGHSNITKNSKQDVLDRYYPQMLIWLHFRKIMKKCSKVKKVGRRASKISVRYPNHKKKMASTNSKIKIT